MNLPTPFSGNTQATFATAYQITRRHKPDRNPLLCSPYKIKFFKVSDESTDSILRKYPSNLRYSLPNYTASQARPKSVICSPYKIKYFKVSDESTDSILRKYPRNLRYCLPNYTASQARPKSVIMQPKLATNEENTVISYSSNSR